MSLPRSGTDSCWRTGYWTRLPPPTPWLATCRSAAECDKDVVPADKCAPCRPAAGARAAVRLPSPLVGEKVKLAADTLFEFNKAVLLPAGKAKLDDLAAKSKDMKLEVILAVGSPTASAATLQPEAVREARRRRQDLPGRQGRRSQPRSHRRQGREAARDRRQVQQPRQGQRQEQEAGRVPAADRRVEIEVIGNQVIAPSF